MAFWPRAYMLKSTAPEWSQHIDARSLLPGSGRSIKGTVRPGDAAGAQKSSMVIPPAWLFLSGNPAGKYTNSHLCTHLFVASFTQLTRCSSTPRLSAARWCWGPLCDGANHHFCKILTKTGITATARHRLQRLMAKIAWNYRLAKNFATDRTALCETDRNVISSAFGDRLSPPILAGWARLCQLGMPGLCSDHKTPLH